MTIAPCSRPPRGPHPFRLAVLIAALLAAPLPFATGPALAQAAGGGAAGPVKAGVVTLQRQQVPVTDSLPGQAAARDSAEIRPLVDGVLTEVLYEPGTDVTKGTPLFRIDSASYDASLLSAEAELESAHAALPAAEAAASRAEKLAGTGVTQADLDTARVTLLQARAAISTAEASVRSAQINVDRTTITAPIDGVVGIPAVSVGDLVTSGQSDALTTVIALDPIYVDVSQASSRMLEYRRRFANGDIEPGEKLGVTLTLENGEEYSGTGTVQAVSSSVSTTTGSVSIRLQFANPDRQILPGMFLRASATLGTTNAFLVPQLAAKAQADGRVRLWLVGADGASEEHFVTPVGSTRNAWIVAEGIEDGAKLMVDNIDTMSGGRKIDPVAVTINADGTLSDQPAAQADPAPAQLDKAGDGAATTDAGKSTTKGTGGN
ncbi:efflux RND transporter periplasmic adaptor subunit [Frigidibacter sp. MR17.14]|uniref:efflux RND transporter periplasmic adaptor subunit n=1 Tax=Frigidibacter sp. MR17.14 TaxID=3126509 RepID=UPI003012B7E4